MCVLPLACFWPNCCQAVACPPLRGCGQGSPVSLRLRYPKHLSLSLSLLLLPTGSHLFVFCSPGWGQPDCASPPPRRSCWRPVTCTVQSTGDLHLSLPLVLNPAESALFLSHLLSKGHNNLQSLTDTQDTTTAASEQLVTLRPSPWPQPCGSSVQTSPARYTWIMYLCFESQHFTTFPMVTKYSLRSACALSFFLSGKWENKAWEFKSKDICVCVCRFEVNLQKTHL